jgi:hypothetical protein
MAKKRTRSIDIKIDKLTNSLELVATGEVFDTSLTQLHTLDKKTIRKKDWLFDWSKEITHRERLVYRLSTIHEPDVIQGLVSLEDTGDHIRVHLVESAAFNRGKGKKYFGVPGNLFAQACRLSFDRGYHGFVSFTAKTALIEHYKTILDASVIGGQLMQITTPAARKLVERYKL